MGVNAGEPLTNFMRVKYNTRITIYSLNMDENKKTNKKVPGRRASGLARARSMTPEQRKEAASEAAKNRWGSPDHMRKATFGSPDRPLRVAGIEIPCYVLSDGTRVLIESGLLTALGMTTGGGKSSSKSSRENQIASEGGKMSQFLQTKGLKPRILEEISVRARNPIKFKLITGGVAHGYEATMLPQICNTVLEARDAGELNHMQNHIAKRCEILIRGLATVGIIALVDEATGYQEIRDRDALQQILDKYVTDEWAKWTRVFPDEYYKNLYRLKGLAYPLQSRYSPSYIGHWTNDVVYKRLAPGVLKALRDNNPRLPSGNRSRRFHQHLTGDYGIPELKKHLDNVIFLMKACTNWRDFERLLNAASPKYGDTIPMQLPEGKE